MTEQEIKALYNDKLEECKSHKNDIDTLISLAASWRAFTDLADHYDIENDPGLQHMTWLKAMDKLLYERMLNKEPLTFGD